MESRLVLLAYPTLFSRTEIYLFDNVEERCLRNWSFQDKPNQANYIGKNPPVFVIFPQF